MFQAYLEGLQQASGKEPSQTNIFPVDFEWSVYIKTYFLQLYVCISSRSSSSKWQNSYSNNS